MADENKVQLTDDMELPPGAVVTPGYEVPQVNPNANGFSDRVIVVHENAAAKASRLNELYNVEPASHDILSTANERGAAKSDDDGVRAAREHAQAQRKEAAKA